VLLLISDDLLSSYSSRMLNKGMLLLLYIDFKNCYYY